MKRIILPLLLFLSSIVFAQEQKILAEPERVEGYYLFIESKPVNEYDYLGTVKWSGTFHFGSGQHSTTRNKLIKRAKKQYPDADGLIFRFCDGCTDKVDVIKFKK